MDGRSSLRLPLLGVALLAFLVPTHCVKGSISLSNCSEDGTQVFSSGFSSEVSSLGGGGTACYANAITGAYWVSDFTYSLFVNRGNQAPKATGVIIDASTAAKVASVAISLPSTSSSVAVQVKASFSSPEEQQLNPLKSYYLAFCVDASTGSSTYTFKMNDTGTNSQAFFNCSDCTSTTGWYDMPITLATSIGYACTKSSGSPSPKASLSPLPTPSHRLSPAAPSPSPAAVAPITANVTANFGKTQPVVDLAAPSASSGSGVAVRSQLNQIQTNDTTLSGIEWDMTTTNSTDTNVTTFIYSAELANSSAALQQAFTFHSQMAQGNFSGLTFPIGASSVKWSVHLHVANSFAAQGISLSYLLSDLSPLLVNQSKTDTSLKKAANSPQANMTTYFLPLSSSDGSFGGKVVTEVQVFDVALVDGTFVFINHSLSAVDGGGYSLVLAFPPFTHSLLYDPSIGLGVLLGSDRGGGEGGDDTALVVAVAVVVPVAVLVVVGAVIVGTSFLYLQRRRRIDAFDKHLKDMNSP